MPPDIKDFATSGETTPAAHAVEVTAGVTVLPTFSRSIYVGGDGDLKVTMAGGEVVTYPNVVAGMVYPYRVASVDAGTTATGIVVIY